MRARIKGVTETLVKELGIKEPNIKYLNNNLSQFTGPNNAQVTVGINGRYANLCTVIDNTGKYGEVIRKMLSTVEDKLKK